MIGFLDPAMLLFAVCAVVPPILAWLGRKDAAVREWAAMELLGRAADRTVVRRRFVDRLVVAMRSAMLLAVAFAAARPFFVPDATPSGPATNAGGAGERRAVVVGKATAVAAAIESAAPDLAPVRSIAEPQFDDDLLESAAVVVLADGVVPDTAATRRLGRFVDHGGAVVLLVGPRTVDGNPAAFNRFAGGLAGIAVDGAIDAPSVVPGEEGPPPETMRLTATADGAAEMDLSGPFVGRRARLVASLGGMGMNSTSQAPPAVLARAVPSGNPLALRIDVGRGAVGVVAVPLAIDGLSGGGWAAGGSPGATGPPAWGDLPAWPAFLPFVERTILSLARPGGGGPSVAASPRGRSLASLPLVAAVLLLLVDPLVSLSTGPWRHFR